MPRILEETEIDPIADELDATMTAAEEQAALSSFAVPDNVPDLTDGGRVGRVKVTPMQNGQKREKGRAAARRAWTWNGSETLLPLAWNPEGTQHDGARRYLLKRHCTCCGFSGFRGVQCPVCVNNNCIVCRGSTVKGKVIPANYLRKEDVPFPARFYGNIDCFLASCPRRGGRGFMTAQDMVMHARSRHRMEYQAHQDTIAATRVDDLETLRQQIAELMAGRRGKPPVTGTPDAPLYVKEPKP